MVQIMSCVCLVLSRYLNHLSSNQDNDVVMKTDSHFVYSSVGVLDVRVRYSIENTPEIIIAVLESALIYIRFSLWD